MHLNAAPVTFVSSAVESRAFVQRTKTGNEQNFDWNRTRNEIKFYSSEQNVKWPKFEMAINQLITLFYRSV